jgi:adenine deaminase
MLQKATTTLIQALPKVELHLHIEGTLEPEMAFALAAKHGMSLPFPSVESLRTAYRFDSLQSFLDIYYSGCNVLVDDRDFYTLAMAYFARAAADNVMHAEIFFDPQSHTSRGVPLATVMAGLRGAQHDAEVRFGITSSLILCPEEAALATLDAAKPFLRDIIGVGLDSSEKGHPPTKFARVFAQARSEGLRLVAHAGEEGPPAYIVEALDLLGVERIDHGVRCEEDAALVQRLVREQVPLTVCPLSNVKLRVVDDLAQHNLLRLLRAGVKISIHSDDPAYFGGYIGDNYRAVAAALPITDVELVALAKNAIDAAFLPDRRKAELAARLPTS